MQPCPRKSEATLPGQLNAVSEWREDGTCSYCGSLSPEVLFRLIADGAELGPTDKNYKVYVEYPDPEVGIPWIYTISNSRPKGKYGEQFVLVTPENIDVMPKCGWRDIMGLWVVIEPKSAKKHGKFYFQHFTEEDQTKFIELLNSKSIRLGYPGHFYRIPYFMRLVDKP